ncbi:hypothetical protein AK830_g4406 [Neonectria ditissima]|uniref:Nephrocystin 3-like N-terminal domain-containing protein n=1 Tax=Neonectria ditissima TaxID=78410 RepID=A0A0P7BNG4_9HYPO|nr:hypothetical protein AK830_g4406 [Neonectria ditissima]
MWLHAKAGPGKTVLCSTVIDHLEEDLLEEKRHREGQPGQRLSALAFYFSPLIKGDEMDLRRFKMSLAAQLFKSPIMDRPDIVGQYAVPKGFQELYRKFYPSKEPHSEHIGELFWSLLPLANQSYIVVDALDECVPNQFRDSVLDFPGAILSGTGGNTHVLLTSRRHSDIEFIIMQLPSEKNVVPFDIKEANGDIQHHLLSVVRSSPYTKWSSDLQSMVTGHLISRSDGVFRWADLQIRALAGHERERDVKKAPQKLPQGLEATYERMLE